MAQRTGMIGVIVTGLVSILLVIRHTRAEEQAGRRELLGAAVVGRHAFRLRDWMKGVIR